MYGQELDIAAPLPSHWSVDLGFIVVQWEEVAQMALKI